MSLIPNRLRCHPALLGDQQFVISRLERQQRIETAPELIDLIIEGGRRHRCGQHTG